MVCFPGPAKDGLNIPLIASVIPIPDHVPPPIEALKVTGKSVSLNGPAGIIAKVDTGFTVTVAIAVLEQLLVVPVTVKGVVDVGETEIGLVVSPVDHE